MKYNMRSVRWLASVLVLTPVLAAQSTSLNGSFGFLINASYFNRPNNNGQALLGVMNFEGAGNVSGPDTAEFGALGNQAAQSIAGTFTGKYSGNTDGTGSVTIALDAGITLTYAMVVTEGGKSLQLVMTNCLFGSEGCNFFATVNSGFARAGQASSLNGSYGFQLNNSPVPNGTLGVMSFDAAGNVAMSFTSVAVGKDDTSGQAPVSTGTLTGTYSINPDGSGTITFPAAAYAFVITDGGSGLLLLQTIGTGSNVSFGTARLQ
jgi:hypothetical protein